MGKHRHRNGTVVKYRGDTCPLCLALSNENFLHELIKELYMEAFTSPRSKLTREMLDEMNEKIRKRLRKEMGYEE